MLTSGMPVVNAAGRALSYEWIQGDAPAKPTLIFLHEGLGSIRQWREFPLKAAAATGCRALVYDRYGYGQSEVLAEPRRDVRFMHDEALIALPELRRRLGDVALLFLALYGIALAVAIGMIAVVGVVVSVFAAAFAGTMAVSGPGGLPYAVAAVGVLAVLVVFAVVQTGLFVFNSASITAFWRREARELETGPDPSVAIEAGPSAHRGGEGETIAEVALERGQQH